VKPVFIACFFLFSVALCGLTGSDKTADLWSHRNLGKAYYETPGAEAQAIAEFREALKLSAGSARDRVNYGLALLRGGQTAEAIRQLRAAQDRAPSIPHTWFNLGIIFKKQARYTQAIAQFRGMLRLVPSDPSSHYNLGVLYKLTARKNLAVEQFEAAARLNPNFAAPHYQLSIVFRQPGSSGKAAAELEKFNRIRKLQEGAAVPEDPEWSIFSEIYDSVESDPELDGTSRQLRFQPRWIAQGLPTAGAGVLTADFANAGHPDLLVYSPAGIQIYRAGTRAVHEPALEALRSVKRVIAADYNNDGWPDLLVIRDDDVELFTNHSGSFSTPATKLASGTYNDGIWLDYDHDYHLDLLLLGEHSILLSNDGSAGFHDQTARFPFIPGNAVSAAILDLFPDLNETDVAVLYRDGRIVIYRDRLLGSYEALPVTGVFPSARAISAIDMNNDGWTDLLVATPQGNRFLFNDHGHLVSAKDMVDSGAPVLADFANRGFADLVVSGKGFRNTGKQRFEPVAVENLPSFVAAVAADFDGDLRVDIAGITPAGDLFLANNITDTGNHAISVDISGVKNLKSAYGAVVEIKAGAWYQRRRYTGSPLHFGLRQYVSADTVRITWPNGLVQNEIANPVDRKLSFQEKPRLMGSCPSIFAWDGERMTFISDVLGVAPLGASSGDGRYFPVNHRERIKLPSGLLHTVDGEFDIRITEELREVSYLDEVALIAVDHPQELQIETSDKFTGPPFAPFKVYRYRKPMGPIAARDQNGMDVLRKIRQKDGQYVDSFQRTATGLAELHYLELEFGDLNSYVHPILVLNGWVDWADGSTFLAASKETPNGGVFPYLQVLEPSGEWRTVIPDMGMPSGKPKSIVVDLSGKLSAGERKLRIVTNLCVYWDDIFLAEDDPDAPLRLSSLTMTGANLAYRGFSSSGSDADSPKPTTFIYESWRPTTMWNPTPGMYTREGDVRRLLARTDDMMVIMGSGDEIRTRFSPRHLPALPAGWTRDFMLLVDGWAKDADSNTAFGDSVEPLPFHGMSSYPYPSTQHFPADRRHMEYRKTFNVRQPVRDLQQLRPR